MLMVQLVIALIIALGASDTPTVASPAANPVSLGEAQVEYQRPPKNAQPHPVNVTWGELKGMYR